jgi:TDG/mug DNA glycosylase family protein
MSESVTSVIAGAACRSFPPAAGDDARVLILGSMPGVASLQAQQYYAHPRNLFWPFMGALFGAGPALPYAARLERLQQCGIAVWDVLAACERPGSLDGRIARASEVANDIAGFRAAQPALERICLNGGKAAEAFARHIARPRPATVAGLRIITLPSTSPANAGQSRDAKFAAWQAALAPYSKRSGSS